MKLIVFSDIHGSAYYTRKLLDIVAKERPDLVAILGDVYNHGPRNPLPVEYDPQKVAAMLNGIKDKLLVIKGNCDSEVDAMISEFHFVDSAVVVENGKRIYLTHGHVYNEDNLPAIAVGDALVYGHFHTVICRKKEGVTILNPGSISLPKDDNHAYLTIENTRAKIVDIEGKTLAECTL